MSIIIESADIETTMLPSPEEPEEGVVTPVDEPSLPVPSDTTIAKMDSYDEDLNANPFFQSFMVTCPELFSQCVLEQWIICVPRRDSLPKYAFTIEDFTHHILRPLPKSPRRHFPQRHLSGDSDGISSCISNEGDADQSYVSSRSNSSCGDNNGRGENVVSPSEENEAFSFSLSSPSIGNTTFLSTLTAASSTNVSGVSMGNLKGNWNYRTLSHVNVEYSGSTLILDIEVPIGGNSGFEGVKVQSTPDKLSSPGTIDEGISIGNTSSILSEDLNESKQEDQRSLPETELSGGLPKVQLRKEVLFEETFYTNDRQKYKVLCVASPLNSKVDIEDENFGNAGLGLWNLTSLRDCIDFLWVKGSPKILSTFDAYIKLFHHNHRGLENFPLKVQKDLVNTLYLKCLNYAVTHGGIVEMEPPSDKIALNEFFLQRLKLATETYVLNGIYRCLISALTSFISGEDSKLNKVMRNLTELTPQDLDIKNIHWDNLTRAKQELGRLNTYSSPLGKLTCMKRTLRYLRPVEPFSGAPESFPLSADELIPIWVYLVVKNPLGNWMAQLEFLRNFRFSIEPFSPLQRVSSKDNENSFYITTLEASLEHLRSGKVLGISDHERDVGMPCDLGEAWLHCVHAKAMECTDSPLGEMFDVIRLGNCPRLEELIEEYEDERLRELKELEMEREGDSLSSTSQKSIDLQGLCHPLCQCESCLKIMIKTSKEMEEHEQELLVSAVNLKTSEGLTMLHVACIYGRPKIVEYLIDAGADLEVQDVDGMTALHFAASRGHQNALLLLLDAGSSLEPRNIAFNTPLHLAAQNGHEGCVKALIYDAERSGKKLHISSRNRKGDTPLHFASRWGFQGIVQILVEHGAAIKVHNMRHVTPLDCAHDIHILKILQRSLRRRSLVEVNHGDFINIEMVQKEESGGIVMLITEPKEPAHEECKATDLNSSLLVAENNNKNSSSSSRQTSRAPSRNSSRAPSRKASTVQTPDLNYCVSSSVSNLNNANQTTRSRRTSNIINPMKGINEETTKSLLRDVAEHLQQNDFGNENNNSFNNDNGNNYRNNINQNVGANDSEHVRKISVQSLEDCRIASAESAFTGLLTLGDAKDRDIKKIFTAIHHNDLPLALFYLGIPAEELSNPDNDLMTIQRISTCHPLCPCVRCVAKNAGLGLGLDMKNSEGYTPLHVAVQMDLGVLVKILIRFGADINSQSEYDKKTPLDVAKEKGFHDIEDVLEKCGAECTTSFALEPQEFWGKE